MIRLLTLGLSAAGFVALAPAGAGASPSISEVFYDAVGSDDGLSFVELWGAPGTDLEGYLLEGINGSNGAVSPSLALSGSIPADGFFVVADGLLDGSTGVAEADLILNFDLQNGPDSLQLLGPDTSVVDALAYGEFAPGEILAGEGSPSVDPPAGQSAARIFANVDTDQNALDFAAAAPSPGSAPLTAVPEPGTALLLCAGLGGLARLGHRPGAARD